MSEGCRVTLSVTVSPCGVRTRTGIMVRLPRYDAGTSPPTRLLHDVSELMSEQTRGGSTGAEDDVIASRIGEGMDRTSGCGGVGIRVDANIAKINAEARLEEGAPGGVERLTRGTENILDDGWSFMGCGGSLSGDGFAVQTLSAFGFCAFTALVAGSFAGTFALNNGLRRGCCDRRGGVGHAKDTVGHVVGFGLERVVGFADAEFALKG